MSITKLLNNCYSCNNEPLLIFDRRIHDYYQCQISCQYCYGISNKINYYYTKPYSSKALLKVISSWNGRNQND